MQNITDKIDGSTTLSAAEFNSLKNELQSFITESGQTLSLAVVDQIRKAVSNYGRSLFVEDSSGTPNVLTLLRPNSFTDSNSYYDGMTLLFSTVNANSGATTINFNSLGVKKVRHIGDFALSGGEIKSNGIYLLIYDSTLDGGSGAFILYDMASNITQRRNYLINGNFKINERAYVSGTATVGSNQYIFDRWYIPTTGQNATFTTTNGIVTVTAPASGIVQKVENISNNGKTMTVSYSGTATLTVTESTDNITYTAVTLTGKTFTPTAGKYIKITLAGGTVSLVKLEDGSVATNYWHPYDGEFGGEVQACQRYYEKNSSFGLALYSATTANAVNPISFNTQKRIAPTVTKVDGTVQNLVSASILWATVSGFSIALNPSTNAISGIGTGGTASWIASSEL
jgi:hypothetical protein